MAQNYVLLERIELNASAASVTFSNIPQTGYTDLKVVISGRSTASAANDNLWMKFNATNTTYTQRVLYGSGSAAASSNSSGNADAQYLAPIPGATSTASTFGNSEVYIPNYTSSNQKSVSLDGVAENNATAAYSQIQAILWNGTSAINSIQFGLISGSYVSGSTFSIYGIAKLGTTPVIAPKADGGNIIATDGTYWYHAFLSSGTFTPLTGLSADVLVVAGGGGGGSNMAGGGGAGGLLSFTSQSLTASNYTCTVGSGGSGSNDNIIKGSNGTNSQFGALTASVGGGGGGSLNATYKSGASGGSGGGGAGGYDDGTGGSGGSATSGQGYAGGAGASGSTNTFLAGAGGGGAGAVGGNGSGNGGSAVGGAGGNGSYTTLTDAIGAATGLGQLVSGHYYFAGGGGGGVPNSGVSAGAGGYGGGGIGGKASGYPAANNAGTANTGGGGGGGNNGGTNPNVGAPGGSGVVIIRYPVA